MKITTGRPATLAPHGMVTCPHSLASVQSLTTVKSTDELPEMYQTKLGMLKIVEPNQPIESIGVRFAGDFDNCYFIVNGDILTTC